MKLWRTPLDSGRISSPRGRVQIRITWCKGCRFCVAFCPNDVLELSSDFNAKGYHYPILKSPDGCVDCKLCERLCPEYSIVVTSLPAQTDKARVPAGRAAQQPAEQG